MTAPTITAGLKQMLAAHLPFSRMDDADLAFLISRVEVVYFAPNETVLTPSSGPPEYCLIVKQGRVRGLLDADPEKVAFVAGVGDLFPVSALMTRKPVGLTYVAVGDTFCLRLNRQPFEELTRRSAPFAEFCQRRLATMLDLSRRELQATYAAQASSEHTMNLPLAELVRGRPVTCRPDETLRDAFTRMHEAEVGSIIVTEAQGSHERVVGILTRTDLIGRVILPEVPLSTPIAEVMSTHVLTLDADATAADATLLMAEHSIRHVPVMRADATGRRLIGVVSERDLFALQRLSVRQMSAEIRRAADVAALAAVAADIRRLSHHLVAQGVAAAQMTRLISHLNDQLTGQVLALACARFGVDRDAFCWLALGSEGRSEQTIATDQDNGIIYRGDRIAQAPLLELADWVNRALASAGFPLCKGNIMARNPQWCLKREEWEAVFADWIDRGSPEALLNASIFFDFRGIFGDRSLADQLRSEVVARAQRTPRFLKQMSDNALRNRPPGAPTVFDRLFGDELGRKPVDLKMHGTVPFVDAARIWALGAGLDLTNTAERFRTLAQIGRLPQEDAHAWVDAFEYLQLMRLRGQHERSEAPPTAPAGAEDNPNAVDPTRLSELDRRILKEAFRQARRVQQRLELDFPG